MRTLAVLFLSLCCYAPLATAQTSLAGKLDRQRATFRHIRQGCGNDANTTNTQTLPTTARTADFTGGFGCPSFTSDNIRLNWVLPTSPITASIPADNATTVPLTAPANDNLSVSIAGAAAYLDSTSEVHSFFSRATLREFTGGQCANAQKTASTNLEGVGSVELAVSALCTLDQARFLTIVPGSIVKQNNQLTAFEAALTFEGVVDLAHGNQVGAPGWRGGAFTITVEAIYKFTVDVVQPPQPQAPRINRGGVVDAAQFQPALSPGGIATIFGSDLAASVVSASTVPLPTALNGVRVFIHGIAAPLFFIAPGQINFQVPFEVPAGATVEVRVERDSLQSTAETVRVNEFAPAVFVDPASKDPIVTRHPDNAVITAANPARPGDVLILYLTGVGGLNTLPATGTPTPGSP
ncbi:MAG: hypothetical protein J0L64_28195, partial [Acidobacteria bacterium]|nr:hypothetical protein [Acidobacteriota bacterium]